MEVYKASKMIPLEKCRSSWILFHSDMAMDEGPTFYSRYEVGHLEGMHASK